MSANKQVITKEKPHFDDQVMKLRAFKNIACFQRLSAKLFEIEMNECRGKNVLHPDISNALETLVEGVEQVQIIINDYLHDACIDSLKTQKELDEEKEQEERDGRGWQRYQSQVNSLYYSTRL